MSDKSVIHCSVTMTARSDDPGPWLPDLASAALAQARTDMPQGSLVATVVEYRGVGRRVRVTNANGDVCSIYGYLYVAGKGYRANRAGSC